MSKKFKIKLIGVCITGVGLLLTPLTMNKYITALDYALFTYFCFSCLVFDMKQRNFTFVDFSNEMEKRCTENFKKKNYKMFVFYASIIPAMIYGLLAIAGIIYVILTK